MLKLELEKWRQKHFLSFFQMLAQFWYVLIAEHELLNWASIWKKDKIFHQNLAKKDINY